MELQDLKKNWDKFARIDALGAICVNGPSWKKREGWTVKEFFESGVSQVTRLMARIEQEGIQLRHQRALDFGCGVGRLTQPLNNYFEEVCGVDISKSMLEQARRYNTSERCKFFLNDRNDLSIFADHSFDFILSLITLQHMEPRYSKNYIREFLRILSLNGLLVFQLKDSRIQQILNRSPKDQRDGSSDSETLPSQIRDRIRRTRRKYRKYDLIHRIKTRGPTMENYTLSYGEVSPLIEENGGKILLVDNPSRSRKWRHAWYYVTRDDSKLNDASLHV